MYLLEWQKSATKPLPVVIVDMVPPQGKDVDTALMSRELAGKVDGLQRRPEEFAHRGYLAVTTFLPFENALYNLSQDECQSGEIEAAVERGSAALQRLLKALRNEPEADLSQVTVVTSGASTIAALALSARHVGGIKAIVNVSGGLYLHGCHPKTVNAASAGF